MSKKPLTEKELAALKPKERSYKVTDATRRGEGTLVIKVLPNGKREFYYRYRHDGVDRTISVGRHQQSPGDGGLTLAEARAKAHELVRQRRDVGDLKGHLEAQRRKAAEVARQAALEARVGTFADLLDAYVHRLVEASKSSAKEVHAALVRHVVKPWPDVAKTKAREIRASDIQAILARMVSNGVQRETNKVRSYLHAAFAFAGKSDNDPRRLAEDGHLFNIGSNPVALVPRIAEFEHAGERVLTADELRLYWEALGALPTVTQAALKLALVLGGQRLTQIARATWEDYDFQRHTLVLRDGKGRGGVRDHLLPLSAWAEEVINPLRLANGDRRWPLANTDRAPLRIETMSAAVSEISMALAADRQVPPFSARDLRRTAETMLASIGVDRETRAQLLSHGRSAGVQAKHYDRYHYLSEKQRALHLWEKHLRNVFFGNACQKVVSLPVTRS